MRRGPDVSAVEGDEYGDVADDANATLVLVEGVKEGRSDLLVLPPLVIYRAEDVYSEEMQAVFDGTVFGEV